VTRALVLLADVVGSRHDGPASSAWLRRLVSELDDIYGDARIAPFGFTQGDELQGLLAADADPIRAVLHASLRDTLPPRMRWVIAAGPVEPGEGPATQRTGPAFIEARRLIDLARRARHGLLARTGDAGVDVLLDDITPALGVLLDGLTDRQRVVGRLLVIDGLRHADAAQRLGIARPTVTVAADRAHLREIEGLGRAVARLVRMGPDGAGPTRPAAAGALAE
jgi:hypothetical protein